MELVLKIAYIWVENTYLAFSELLCYSKHCILWELKARDRKNTVGRFFSLTGVWLLLILALLFYHMTSLDFEKF